MLEFFLFLLGVAMVKVAISPLSELLLTAGVIKENYEGVQIPTALGLVFPLTLPLSLACLTLKRAFFNPGEVYLLLFITTGMGLAGLCDDLLKTDKEKGFRGHFAQLLRGKLTSGALKAITGLVFGFIFTSGLWILGQTGWLMLIPQTLVVALSTNSINLFDLRPGRAVKFFLFLSALFFLLLEVRGVEGPYFRFLYPVIGGLFAYLPVDIKAHGMLGDTGANFLGALLGAVVVLTKDEFLLWFALLFFLFLQLSAEKFSFSQVIEGNRVLRFLDQLGRD